MSIAQGWTCKGFYGCGAWNPQARRACWRCGLGPADVVIGIDPGLHSATLYREGYERLIDRMVTSRWSKPGTTSHLVRELQRTLDEEGPASIACKVRTEESTDVPPGTVDVVVRTHKPKEYAPGERLHSDLVKAKLVPPFTWHTLPQSQRERFAHAEYQTKRGQS